MKYLKNVCLPFCILHKWDIIYNQNASLLKSIDKLRGIELVRIIIYQLVLAVHFFKGIFWKSQTVILDHRVSQWFVYQWSWLNAEVGLHKLTSEFRNQLVKSSSLSIRYWHLTSLCIFGAGTDFFTLFCAHTHLKLQ